MSRATSLKATTLMRHIRVWVTPQNIIALLLLLAGGYAYRWSHSQQPQPHLSETPTLLAPVLTPDTASITAEREITLVSLQDSLSSPRIVLLDESLPLEPSQAVKSILDALQARYPELWLEGLELRQVFSTTLLNGQNSIILNFALEPNIYISVQEERALYNSIKQTLARNGYQQFFILINDAPSPVFIHHVMLPEQLH